MDAMVGHPILWEVVGADLVRSVARADQRLPGGRVLLALPAPLGFLEPRTKHGHRLGLVLVLALLVLDLDDGAGREVRDPHGRVGRVDRLATGARGALDLDPQVPVLVDLDLVLLDLGEYDDRRRRRVDPAARFGRGHSLDTVRPALELESRVRAVAGDLDDRLLDAPDPGLVEAHDLGLVAMAIGVAEVHPEELV